MNTAVITSGWEYEERNGIGFYILPHLKKYNVTYGFTARFGGKSTGKLSSLNLSIKRKDSRENVFSNFEGVCKSLDIDEKKLIIANYVHGPSVYAVTPNEAGQGHYAKNTLPECDGLATISRGLPICTLHADCAPIVIYDTKRHAGCVVHSGWKGTLGQISKRAVETMSREFGTDPSMCVAGIGPSIGRCCFEVDAPVMERFKKAFPKLDCIDKRGEKYHIDLAMCNSDMLLNAGLPIGNIYVSDECTYCNEKHFFSFRRDGEGTGAMAQVMQL